jgi:ATP-dependent RNA helicase DeaD
MGGVPEEYGKAMTQRDSSADSAQTAATDATNEKRPPRRRRKRAAAKTPSGDRPQSNKATEEVAASKPLRSNKGTQEAVAAGTPPRSSKATEETPASKPPRSNKGPQEAVAGKPPRSDKGTEEAVAGKPGKRRPPAENVRRSAPPPAEVRSPAPASGFAAMGLSRVMLASLAEAEYIDPTPIQAGLIPQALKGIDLMGQAQTGTGKTAAFGIPILERLEPRSSGAGVQALALVPTRELAVQVRDECVKLASGHDARIVAVYGGKPIRQQVEHLRRGAEIVVGTPGRVIDLIGRGSLVLGSVRFVVLDEADRMLDIGFRPDIEKILRRCPQSRQTLLLSATIPPPVKRLAERYMRDPQMVDFSTKDLAVETIEQSYFTVDPERKFELLAKLIERENPRQAIVFCRTKRGTDKIYRRLSEKIKGVDTIHGDLQQSARDRVMRSFRDGKTKVLVATDVVGRGIDVSTISHIINYDIPQFCDDYVHRVGRTGRMGREGIAFTFVTPEEGNELTRIEMRINRLLKRDELPGFVALAKPQPTEELDAEGDDSFEPPPSPKPVFGRPVRRIRRAL